MSLAKHALNAVEAGWWVIPLWGVTGAAGQPGGLHCACPKGARCTSPGKHPLARLVPRGLSQGSDRADIIERWWAETPDANIGVVCGPSGLLVIDLDGDDGIDAWDRLAVSHGEYLDSDTTYVVRTGRADGHSFHLYFTLPEGVELRPGAGRLGPGIDHRSGQSYVVAAGSRHVSGKVYAEIGHTLLAQAPPWLIEALKSTERIDAGEDAFIERFHGEGGRNDWLTSVGGYLRSRGVGRDGLVGALVALNRVQCQPPLEGDEVAKICRSLLGYPPVNNQHGGGNIDERRDRWRKQGSSQSLVDADHLGRDQ